MYNRSFKPILENKRHIPISTEDSNFSHVDSFNVSECNLSLGNSYTEPRSAYNDNIEYDASIRCLHD